MNLRPRRGEDPEISLVSMIDVVLMLLIFFMLSTTFIHPSRIRVDLPKASVTAPPGASPITVTVTRRGLYLVNGRALINSRPSTLRAALERLAGRNRRRPVILRADARASTQAIVTVMDVAGSLGFNRINILTTHDSRQ